MSSQETGSGLPERGRQGVDPKGTTHDLPPESERRLLKNRRRFERSSDWSMRLALILLGVLVLLIVISWLLGGRS